MEHDFIGRDCSLNAKAINLWPLDFTGMFVGSYFQSLTRNVALGVESMYQRQSPEMTDLATSYIAKFTGTDKNWIGTAVIQAAGLLQATYWHRLNEKVEVSAELQLVNAPHRREAMASLATKYDLKLSSFRAQLDSNGKVSAWLEQRFSPAFIFSVGGEIDHFKVSISLLENIAAYLTDALFRRTLLKLVWASRLRARPCSLRIWPSTLPCYPNSTLPYNYKHLIDPPLRAS